MRWEVSYWACLWNNQFRTQNGWPESHTNYLKPAFCCVFPTTSRAFLPTFVTIASDLVWLFKIILLHCFDDRKILNLLSKYNQETLCMTAWCIWAISETAIWSAFLAFTTKLLRRQLEEIALNLLFWSSEFLCCFSATTTSVRRGRPLCHGQPPQTRKIKKCINSVI